MTNNKSKAVVLEKATRYYEITKPVGKSRRENDIENGMDHI